MNNKGVQQFYNFPFGLKPNFYCYQLPTRFAWAIDTDFLGL